MTSFENGMLDGAMSNPEVVEFEKYIKDFFKDKPHLAISKRGLFVGGIDEDTDHVEFWIKRKTNE